MTAIYFLANDLALLRLQIDELTARLKTIRGDMALSVGQSSETWHDNFGFEDGRRQLTMWSRRLRELQDLAMRAELVQAPRTPTRVVIGCRVTIEDQTGDTRAVRIGSYMNLGDEPGTVSYHSPLGRMLMGATEGEERTANINGKTSTVIIQAIEGRPTDPVAPPAVASTGCDQG